MVPAKRVLDVDGVVDAGAEEQRQGHDVHQIPGPTHEGHHRQKPHQGQGQRRDAQHHLGGPPEREPEQHQQDQRHRQNHSPDVALHDGEQGAAEQRPPHQLHTAKGTDVLGERLDGGGFGGGRGRHPSQCHEPVTVPGRESAHQPASAGTGRPHGAIAGCECLPGGEHTLGQAQRRRREARVQRRLHGRGPAPGQPARGGAVRFLVRRARPQGAGGGHPGQQFLLHGRVQTRCGNRQALAHLGLVTARDDQPQGVIEPAHLALHLRKGCPGPGIFRTELVGGRVHGWRDDGQHHDRESHHQRRQHPGLARCHPEGRRGSRGGVYDDAGQGWQVQGEHHGGGQQDADPHQGTELGQAREAAAADHEEGSGGGGGRPQDPGGHGSPNLGHRAMGIGDPLLVEDETVVRGQAEQDGGEAEAHGVEGAEDQAAHGHRYRQHQHQQSHEPQERAPAAVRQPEQRRNQQQRAHGRELDVPQQTAADFLHEGRVAGDIDHHRRVDRLVDPPRRDALLHRRQPAARLPEALGVLGGSEKEYPERSVRAREGIAGAVGQQRAGRPGHVAETVGVPSEAGHLLGLKRGRHALEGASQYLVQAVVAESLRHGLEIRRRLVEPEIGEELGESFGILAEGALPDHVGAEPGGLEALGQGADGARRQVRVGRPQRHDQLPGRAEGALVQPQPLHRRRSRRQQIEYVHVQSNPQQARHQDCQHQRCDPQRASHGSSNNRMTSPVSGFRIHHSPAASFSLVQSPRGLPSSRSRGRSSHTKRSGGLPRPECDCPPSTRSILHCPARVLAVKMGSGGLEKLTKTSPAVRRATITSPAMGERSASGVHSA